MKRSLLVFAVLISVFGLSGCGGSAKPVPGTGCALNSDCASGLICIFGLCHSACMVNGDCSTGERCVKSNAPAHDGGFLDVCQLPAELKCIYNSDCQTPLVCARDEQCRNECHASVDCVSPQICTPSGVCALQSELGDSNDVPLVTTDRTDGGVWGVGGASTGAAGATGSGGATGLGGSVTGAGGAAGSSGQAGAGGSAGMSGHSPQDGSADSAIPPPSCVAGVAGFHPSNLPLSLSLPANLPAVTLSGMVTFDTDALKLSTATADGGQWSTMVVTMSGGYQAAVAFFDTFTLASGSTLQITGMRPLILVANGDVELDGTIVGIKSPTNGWYGGGPPAPSTATRGGLCALNVLAGGGAAGSYSTMQGAGGGGYCGPGGNGSALPDGGTPPAGGIPYGTATLTPLAGGASGGSTNGSDTTNHGGGAVEIVSGSLLTVGDNGIINLGGGGTDPGYGVGGGSGGGILLEAPTVVVRGILAVNGGSGSATGGVGSQPGQPTLQPAMSGNGQLGGNGSAGANINGGNAAIQSTLAGGGGGAGRIRINTGCGGSFESSSGALISPASATACFTTGSLN